MSGQLQHTVAYTVPMEIEAGWVLQSVRKIWRTEKYQIPAGIRARDCVFFIPYTRPKFLALWTKVYKLVPVLAILIGPHTQPHTRYFQTSFNIICSSKPKYPKLFPLTAYFLTNTYFLSSVRKFSPLLGS